MRPMADWLTYSPSDFLLFAPRTYYRLFALYNQAIWPGQLLALAAGITILLFLLRGGTGRARAALAILAAAWLWVAWAFLLQRYDTINWVARYFAVGFALQALLLAGWAAMGRPRLESRLGGAGRFGVAVVLFALVGQPLLGPLMGRAWAQAEVFGIAPDPTAVGTLGVLLVAKGRMAWALFAIPLAWCAITGATLATMESPDAFVTPLVAAVSLAVAMGRRRAKF